MSRFRNNIFRNLSNLPGWRTRRKIIVIESDDWGSIRMPSKMAFARLKNSAVDLESLDHSRYNLYDTLANRSDLNSLFDVLDSVKDKSGKPCVFTAVSVVANPDFKKIEENNFEKYFFEPFTRTLERYYPGNDVFSLWKEGIERKLFVPQFHGREHLNVEAWMRALKKGHRNARLAFKEGLWGFVPDYSSELPVDHLAAFQLSDSSDLKKHAEILIEGLNLFESLFGYRAEYFVAPNGHSNSLLNALLAGNGIKYKSAAKIQHESIDLGKTGTTFNWLGKRDKNGIRFITRNCFFEPSCNGIDWVDSCLNDIKIAFRWNKPAIISSHRVNYIGVHYVNNRENSLRALKKLLGSVIMHWPDVEFLTTDMLGNLMSDNNN
jgi:hypothetical protein